MANAVLNSNSSSALISALDAVSSAKNPFEYSYASKGTLDYSHVPAHARVISTSQCTSPGFNQNNDFQVLKSGILENGFIKMTLTNKSGAAADYNPFIGNLQVAEIQLITQGKVICSSRPFGRACLMSDAPYGRKKNMEKGAAQMKIDVKKDNNNAAANANKKAKVSTHVLDGAGGAEVGAKSLKQMEEETYAQNAKKISTVQVKRPATVKMDTAITLYMPPSVQVSYNATYTDTEIGAAAAVGAQAFNDVVSGKGLGETVNKSLKTLGPEIGDGMIRKALGAIDMIPGLEGAMEVVEMQRGFIKTPRLELAFKGIPKRSFQYDFKMIPKSAEEAEEIQKIIKGFKLNMLPEMVDGGANRLTMPNTFDIQYMYNGGENSYLHKISTCVLETMNVTYGGDRYKTFEANANGAPPVEVSISLAFKEMDLITREKANEGF